MDIDVVIAEIKKRIPNTEILCVCKTGSELFCDNCHDTDLVVIVERPSWDKMYFKLSDLDIDVFCFSKDRAYALAKGVKYIYGIGFALATGDNLLYGKLPFDDYSWDKYKFNVLKVEYDHFTMRLLRRAQRSGICEKRMTWAFATYFVIKNNSLNFTDEQSDILQKCHDMDLPVSYADELKRNMEIILKEQVFM